jgi:poly-gamma-glutamate synthesis protein (capsule biosynthesis protein)
MLATPAFAREYAQAAVDAGAGVVLVQGAHAPMRGIEVRDGVPVFYDPGPLFRLGRREQQPHDFYTRWGNAPGTRSFDAGVLDAYGERDTALGGGGSGKEVLSPAEGNAHQPGFFVPVCEVDRATHRVTRVALHPMSWSRARRATAGFPVRLTGAKAATVLERVAELSEPYGTRVVADSDTGWVST